MRVVLMSLVLVCSFAFAASAQTGAKGSEKKDAAAAAAEHDYDPARDAEKDVREAVAAARESKRHVLLEVGGKWCVWCRIMDKYFADHAELLALREKNFVTIKINFSPENENRALLSKYPEIPGYPHLFVLDAEVKLLHSQNTEELEEGKSYNYEKFTAFLKKWSPAEGRPVQ